MPEDLYAKDYWQTYRALDQTDTGRLLTAFRARFVLDHYRGDDLIDVGIGGGRFVLAADCHGWDINPQAIRWLYEASRLRDPRAGAVEAISMWDSLEHIPNPSEMLENVRTWVFVSTPIYRSAAHALKSKHFKPGEHLWYFTLNGISEFMRLHGFEFVTLSDEENALGRESIGTFAFRRRRT